MITAILFVSVMTLVLTLRNAWVVQDTRWCLSALYEKVSRIESGDNLYCQQPEVID